MSPEDFHTWVSFSSFLTVIVTITYCYSINTVDLSELFQHDSLAVMTMMTFAVSTTEIDNPLTALCCFLDTFSKMNWATSLVTATGILPKKSNSNVLESISSLKVRFYLEKIIE